MYDEAGRRVSLTTAFAVAVSVVVITTVCVRDSGVSCLGVSPYQFLCWIITLLLGGLVGTLYLYILMLDHHWLKLASEILHLCCVSMSVHSLLSVVLCGTYWTDVHCGNAEVHCHLHLVFENACWQVAVGVRFYFHSYYNSGAGTTRHQVTVIELFL